MITLSCTISSIRHAAHPRLDLLEAVDHLSQTAFRQGGHNSPSREGAPYGPRPLTGPEPRFSLLFPGLFSPCDLGRQRIQLARPESAEPVEPFIDLPHWDDLDAGSAAASLPPEPTQIRFHGAL